MADWSQKLPTPLQVGKRKLRTLDDLRAYILALPKDASGKPGWEWATEAVLSAAEDGNVTRAQEAFRFAPVHAPGLTPALCGGWGN